MNAPNSLPPSPFGRRTRTLLGGLFGVLLGGAVLSLVAAQPGSRTATVVVHVTEPDVVVAVGGASFSVEGVTYTPFVREVAAGTHRMTMWREGALLHDETFTVDGGEVRVLTAWRPAPPAAPGG